MYLLYLPGDFIYCIYRIVKSGKPHRLFLPIRHSCGWERVNLPVLGRWLATACRNSYGDNQATGKSTTGFMRVCRPPDQT